MQQHGPWQIVRSHAIYKDAWLEVRKDDVIRPDGAPGTHGVVLLKPGVSVLALDDEQRVYLTDEFHYGVGRRTIEVVSGGREIEEDPLAAARRELEEELGITADEWIALGSFDPFTTMLSAPAELYLARRLTFGAARQEGTENIRCVKVGFDEAIAMVMDGRITHGPSCVVILKAARLIRRS
jgi:ADP-ribose pyrophosphatase